MELIDLHTHSTFSDGVLSPELLVETAKNAGLAAIALTDHDTAAGTGRALVCGQALGLEVITGIELSACLDGVSMHILGYGIRPGDPLLLKRLQLVQDERHNRNCRILAKLKKSGININIDELGICSGAGQAGRPHIARLLVKKKVVANEEDAFRLFLKKGGRAYADRKRLSAAKAIEMINEAGGLAFLAHPGCIDKTLASIPRLLRVLKEIGLSGVEAYYPGHSFSMRNSLNRLAAQTGLLISGGSDFHDANRRPCAMAGTNGALMVPYELLTRIKNRLAKSERRRNKRGEAGG